MAPCHLNYFHHCQRESWFVVQGEFQRADVAFDKRTGEFYVADGYSNARVHKYTPDGRLLFSWRESGTGDGQFNIVHNVIVDNDGWVYVADRENQRIQVFSSYGKYETQWGNLSRADAICIDDRSGEELIYIGEYFCGIATNDIGTDLGPRVTVINTRGKVLARVGRESYGDQSGRFYSPPVPRQLYLPVGVNQFCRFTSLAWTRCWAALVR